MHPVDALSRYPLFAMLGRDRLAGWVEMGERMTVPAGEAVLQARSPGRHIFLTESGGVRVLRYTQAGREVSFGTLGPGEVFGEYALLPPHTNAASCRARTPARLLRLPLPLIQRALGRRPTVQSNLKNWLRLHSLLGYLRERPFLGFQSGPSALALLDRCHLEHFPAGRTIQADGLAEDRWYVVRTGKVLLREEADKPFPRTVELGPGDCFGERGLAALTGLPTAVTDEPTECLSLRRDDFLHPHSAPAALDRQTFSRVPIPSQMSFPWVGQQEEADCGVAALAMIAQFYHRCEALADVRRLVAVGADGCTLASLQVAAGRLGFGTRSVRVGWDQLGNVTLPAIAHFADGHYVVLYAMESTGFTVGDPARGVARVSPKQFYDVWSGALLLILP